ncbi:MAG: hypothetical protein JWQ57_3228 [Mucilaginibacter sp.]|nr:hypothetical protein [Mucilaginibacter sp.]
MITSFPSIRSANQPGIAAFEFAPYNNVAVFPPVINNVLSGAITFKDGGAFLTGYSTPDKLDMKVDFTPDENSGYYQNQLTGFTPKDNPTLLQLFTEMNGMRFIAKSLDFNGRMRLLGHNAPLTFTASYAASGKGYSWAFSGQSTDPAPFFP